MDITFTPEYDFIDADSEYIRECIVNQDSEDFGLVYNATQRFIEHVTDLVTKRHDIPADIRILIEKMKAFMSEAAETFKVIYEEQAGDA